MECCHENISQSDNHFHCTYCGCIIPSSGTLPILDPSTSTVIKVSPIDLVKDMLSSLPKNLFSVKNIKFVEKRKNVFEWIMNACIRLNLTKRTAHVAAFYTDFVLNSNEYGEENHFPIALACLYIASKFSDFDQNVPFLQDFLRVTKLKLEPVKIKEVEIYLLKSLGWNLRIATVYEIVMNFLTYGVLFENDIYLSNPVNYLHAKLISHYAQFFSDQILVEPEFLDYDLLSIATSIIYVSRKAAQIEAEWNSELIEITRMDLKDFEDCRKILLNKFSDIIESAKSLNSSLIDSFKDSEKKKNEKDIYDLIFNNDYKERKKRKQLKNFNKQSKIRQVSKSPKIITLSNQKEFSKLSNVEIFSRRSNSISSYKRQITAV